MPSKLSPQQCQSLFSAKKREKFHQFVVCRICQESGKANYTYSQLSLSRIPRDSLKYFEISVLRHTRFAELRKKQFD